MRPACRIWWVELNSVRFTLQLSLEHLHVLCIPMLIVSVMLFMNMIKEFVQMYQQVAQFLLALIPQRLSYFGDPVNMAEWALYVTAAVFVVPLMLFGRLCTVQWQCGAIAVFLAWFNLLLYLQRCDHFFVAVHSSLDSIGIYVIMFLQILSTVLRVACVFSVLFIAFGFAFKILTANSVSVFPIFQLYLVAVHRRRIASTAERLPHDHVKRGDDDG